MCCNRAARHFCNAASCNAKTNVVQHRQVESGSLLALTNEQADGGFLPAVTNETLGCTNQCQMPEGQLAISCTNQRGVTAH